MATTLTEPRLEAIAGESVFGRGIDYTRYVRGMRVDGDTATGSIQARNVYLVDLDWSGPTISGSCTCPHFADGNFCKHLVALGLCVIDGGHVEEPEEAPAELAELLDGIGETEVRDLVLDLARRDDGVRRELELRRAVVSGDTGWVADDLVAFVRDQLAVRGFIDYRRSFEVAQDAQFALDELERCLDTGAPDVAQPALLRAVTRLRKLTEQADDSGGVIGDACQRSADLYARACREGSPDPVKLAKWLLKFRATSPGWPHVKLADFVAAFDDRAMKTYRRGVAKLDEEHADAGRWGRFDVDQMLLELADHDGDVNRAIELLSDDEHTQYGAIVARLRDAGRDDEVVTWIDRAVAAGRVVGRLGRTDFHLMPMDVAETYRDLGRDDDALDVLLADFRRNAGRGAYRAVGDFADGLGRGEAVREEMLAIAREQAQAQYGTGAALVDIALGEGDLDAAWEAAEEYGAGHLWQPLADVSADERPVAAADLYRPGIEQDLVHPNTKLYPEIAKALARMKELYARGGKQGEFATYLAEIREQYRRRPSLMAALDRAGL